MKTLRPYQADIVSSILQRLKESDEPILIDASVGSGKSLILSSVLLVLERAGFHALCLTLNSTLIKQNANTYKLQGGNPSLYCASLNTKDCENFVTFASPNSVCQDIRNKGKVSKKPFRLIVIDEVHNLAIHNESSMYVRIIRHYSMLAQEAQYSFKIIGLTGTPYRGKNELIYGADKFFKSKLCEISAPWLIENGYLTQPCFGITHVDGIDFSHVRVEKNGKFRHKDLEAVLAKDERLTGEIMREVVNVRETGNHHGAFIFAATVQHCYECFKSLPEGQAAIITGDTSHDVREKILMEAQAGSVKYLISVNCLMVGIDVPAYDMCVWCRPTESLILYIQGIGRVLRLSPRKDRAVILDYAGNLERHGDIDNPILNEGIKRLAADDADYCIPCYTCNTNNKVTARRCIGVIEEKRCDHYFEWKECTECQAQNDITSRQCRNCEKELIDPNAKLTLATKNIYELDVKSIECRYAATEKGFRIDIVYNCHRFNIPEKIYQSYYLVSEKSVRFFYGNFIKIYFNHNPSYWMSLNNMLENTGAAENLLYYLFYSVKPNVPDRITCERDENFIYKYKSAIFV